MFFLNKEVAWITIELRTFLIIEIRHSWTEHKLKQQKVPVKDQTYHRSQLALAFLLIHSLLPSLAISKDSASSVDSEIVVNADLSDEFCLIASHSHPILKMLAEYQANETTMIQMMN